MAQETGNPFDGFEKSKYASGEFFDKYINQEWKPATKRVEKLFKDANIDIPTQHDWENLSKYVRKHGLYNQNLQAVPPTGSISYINNSTSSIHPIASQIEIRKEGKLGRVYYPAPFLNNDNLEYFQDAYEIGPEAIIDTYAAATQHVDQGLSLTLFFKDTATTRDVNKAQIYAWKKGIKTIYYAPTGDLYNVPFHAIYAPKGTGDEIVPEKLNSKRVVIYPEYAKTEQDAAYLMDRYTLHQLTSTRYLALGLKQKATEPVGTNLAMVGAVNYDYLPESVTAPANNKIGETQNLSSNYAYGKLDYLEGTKTEVDVINQQVSAASWQTTVLEGNDATEEKITKMEGKESREIMHLATHGFAFPAYDFQDTTISQNSLKYSYRYSTNPMVRSGLILAGGNWAWTGSDSLTKVGAEQNGILTALEVSQLNLKKTKLVVLSACETGLGKIEGNEGTFGLKRGFKLAGVEQMIVSLWTIPDQETQELMSLFYSDLTQTKSPTLSFQKAQQAMKEKYPTSPFLWAGFVLVR